MHARLNAFNFPLLGPSPYFLTPCLTSPSPSLMQIVGLEVEPGQKAILYSSSGTTITVTNEGDVSFDPPMKTDETVTELGDVEGGGSGRRRLLARADVQVSLNAGGAAAMRSDAPTVDPGRWTNSRSAREQSAKIAAMLDRNVSGI